MMMDDGGPLPTSDSMSAMKGELKAKSRLLQATLPPHLPTRTRSLFSWPLIREVILCWCWALDITHIIYVQSERRGSKLFQILGFDQGFS